MTDSIKEAVLDDIHTALCLTEDLESAFAVVASVDESPTDDSVKVKAIWKTDGGQKQGKYFRVYVTELNPDNSQESRQLIRKLSLTDVIISRALKAYPHDEDEAIRQALIVHEKTHKHLVKNLTDRLALQNPLLKLCPGVEGSENRHVFISGPGGHC